MAEYISREDLIERIELSIASWSGDCNSNAPVITRTYQEVLDRVKHLPSADVAEVKHGKWLTRDIHGLEKEVMCSVCYSRTFYPPSFFQNIRYSKYCPDCGAKMDGERK